MSEIVISLFTTIPAEWAIFFLSMLPVTELRATIPLGLEVYQLPVSRTFVLAVIGNLVPTTIFLLLIPYLHEWLLRQKFIGKALKRKMEQTENKFSGKYEKYGAIALLLFVAIPLPLTGAWTGSLAAFLFNIPPKKSIPLIAVGVVIAGVAMTLITLFAGSTVRALF